MDDFNVGMSNVESENSNLLQNCPKPLRLWSKKLSNLGLVDSPRSILDWYYFNDRNVFNIIILLFGLFADFVNVVTNKLVKIII